MNCIPITETHLCQHIYAEAATQMLSDESLRADNLSIEMPTWRKATFGKLLYNITSKSTAVTETY